jgi:LPPG:FO 2-phospho-L-lactate transferase
LSRYIAITGGIGGAKLCLGLVHALDADALDFVVNTGDDFEHLGLAISPDVDTLTYTLAGLVNTETGWGRANETWNFMAALRALGGEPWFNLGDADLALHVERTHRLATGERLTTITRTFAAALGAPGRILPMSDDPVRTLVATREGELAFQHYFVRERCAPAVTGFRFDGAASARLTPEIERAFERPDLEGIVICPSNPFVSIGPVLAIPALRQRIATARVPVVAVSPIVAGLAIKGPTAKMMAELGVPASALAVARHYAEVIDGFVLDASDVALTTDVEALGIAAVSTPTVMLTLGDRVALARRTLEFIQQLR